MKLESVVQRELIKYMEAEGYFVTKLLQTTTNGIPDLLCIKDGRTVFIEAKREGRTNIIEPLQVYRHKQLRQAGATVIIARSVDELKKYL